MMTSTRSHYQLSLLSSSSSLSYILRCPCFHLGCCQCVIIIIITIAIIITIIVFLLVSSSSSMLSPWVLPVRHPDQDLFLNVSHHILPSGSGSGSGSGSQIMFPVQYLPRLRMMRRGGRYEVGEIAGFNSRGHPATLDVLIIGFGIWYSVFHHHHHLKVLNDEVNHLAAAHLELGAVHLSETPHSS